MITVGYWVTDETTACNITIPCSKTASQSQRWGWSQQCMSVLGSIPQAVYVEHDATVFKEKNLIPCGERLVCTFILLQLSSITTHQDAHRRLVMQVAEWLTASLDQCSRKVSDMGWLHYLNIKKWMNECWEKPQKCTCISNPLAFLFPSLREPWHHSWIQLSFKYLQLKS